MDSNSDSREREMFVVESSEDEGENDNNSVETATIQQDQPQAQRAGVGVDDQQDSENQQEAHAQPEDNIRYRIDTARLLLEDAEVLSRPRPEPNNSNIQQQELSSGSNSIVNSRYGISRNVTASDFYPEREMETLFDTVSALRNRLSVERIYNFGPPQCQEEREIFDELLMTRFSDLITVGERESRIIPSSDQNESVVEMETDNTNRNGEMNAGCRNRCERDSSDNVLQLHPVSSIASSMSRIIRDIDIPSTSGTATNPTRNQTQQSSSSSTHSHSHQQQKRPLESDLSFAQAGSSFSPHSPIGAGGGVMDSSSQMVNYVRKLRSFIEESSEAVAGDRELVTAVSEFLQYVKKSPVLSSAIVSSPSITPSKPRKRQRQSDSPSVKIKKDENGESSDEEESCTICLEPWTTGGDHRICCLKCGHMFGFSCISKWVKQAHNCPQCKMPAKMGDVRNLFARKMKAEDTSERDRAMKLLEEERIKTRSLEHKEAIARRNLDAQNKLISSLESRLSLTGNMASAVASQGRPEGVGASSGGGAGGIPIVTSSSASGYSLSINSGLPSSTQSRERSRDGMYQIMARISITHEGNCRVFEHSNELGMVVVSTKSTNALFRGFGIKTLSRDFRVLSYQPLHSALIRDMSFRPNTFDGTLLSCGMDKVIQLMSVTSKCVIHKFTMANSAWCCAWDTVDNNLFYVGMERGIVREFDMRRTDSHTRDVLDLGGAPIASVSYLDGGGLDRSTKGLLIAQIRNLVFREKTGDEFTTHMLPRPQAPIMGSYATPDGHFLTSHRPTSTNPRCQYEVGSLKRGREDTVISDNKASWEGGTLQPVISRNCLFACPDSDHRLLAATANHQSNTVKVWDVSRQSEHQSLQSFDKAIDIKPISFNQQNLLGILSDSELILYKWSCNVGNTICTSSH